jgi:anti-anti-sigma factor
VAAGLWDSCGQNAADSSCPDLAIITECQSGRAALRLQGELDAGSRDRLRRAISDALEGRPRILVIDLAAVNFADCGGLAVLVSAHQQLAQQGCDLIIMAAQPMVSRLICLTGLDTYLHLGGRLGGGGT